MTDRVFILPHSAAERSPQGGSVECSWPTAEAEHARKFLETRGTWLARVDGTASCGELKIWCEYEAPTAAAAIHQETSQHPAWVHRIDLSALRTIASAGASRRHLNTDPWVWDSGFIWSVCRHFTSTKKLRPAVARLGAGDIVLFGSSRGGRWLLDTVLVAAEPPIRCKQAHVAIPSLGAAYRECVSEPLGVLRLPLAIVRGVPHGAGAGPFSFVPALPSGARKSFARIDITSIVEQVQLHGGRLASAGNARALASGTYPGGNRQIWSELAQRTIDAGLVLAVSFEHPHDDARATTSSSASSRARGRDHEGHRVTGLNATEPQDIPSSD